MVMVAIVMMVTVEVVVVVVVVGGGWIVETIPKTNIPGTCRVYPPRRRCQWRGQHKQLHFLATVI